MSKSKLSLPAAGGRRPLVPEQRAKIIRRVGRPEVSDEKKQQVLTYARAGCKRKEIAAETGVKSLKTVTKILHDANIFMPRGGDRRNPELRREAPAGLHDKHVSIDDAAAWARSAYDNTRLKPENRQQRELPRTLEKKFNSLGIAKTIKF